MTPREIAASSDKPSADKEPVGLAAITNASARQHWAHPRSAIAGCLKPPGTAS